MQWIADDVLKSEATRSWAGKAVLQQATYCILDGSATKVLVKIALRMRRGDCGCAKHGIYFLLHRRDIGISVGTARVLVFDVCRSLFFF
jgi:hypothetical protein